MTARILLIDDDDRFRTLLATYLEHTGFAVAQADSGVNGLERARAFAPELVVLDIMMPGLDGHDVLRRLRDLGEVPIIFLSAKGDEVDRVSGLELGADDYLTKPCSARELVARIRTVLRRSGGASGPSWRLGDLIIDGAARQVSRDSRPVELTATELDILIALARERGRAVPRDALRKLAGRGDTVVGDRSLDVHIHRLRKKLDLTPPGPHLQTVRGIGYALAGPAEEDGSR
ncbi:MAG: response regulator transcription factor [Myxococcota bacterium]